VGKETSIESLFGTQGVLCVPMGTTKYTLKWQIV